MEKLICLILAFCMLLTLFSVAVSAEQNANALTLYYDDYYTFDGAVSVQSTNSSVLTVSGTTLHAVGITQAPVTVNVTYADGTKAYAVTVKKAKINIMLIAGQSNAYGATSGVPDTAASYKGTTCKNGTAYLWGANATKPAALTGGGNYDGFRAALAAEWYEQSVLAGAPEKTVMVFEGDYTATPGETVAEWLSTTTSKASLYKSAPMVNACYDYYTTGAGAAYYEMASCGMYWLQGESDKLQTANYYYTAFDGLWKQLKEATNDRMDYCAFMRVRGGKGSDSTLNYSGPVVAQYQLANDNDDIFMASTITENWNGTNSTVTAVDVSKFNIFDEAQYSSVIENGVITETQGDIYGGLHYSRLGYNIIGADAAYNMYRSLHTSLDAIVLGQTNGTTAATAQVGSTVTIAASGITNNLMLHIAPASGASDISFKIECTGSDGRDITAAVSNGIDANDMAFLINTTRLLEYVDPVITVTTHGKTTKFIIDTDATENPDPFGESAENAVYYHWDFTDTSTYKAGLLNGTVATDKALNIKTAADSDAYGLMTYSNAANPSVTYSATSGIVRDAVTNDYFTITNKDGGTGVVLSNKNGFMMEFTASFTNNSDIIFGKGPHPYFFRSGANRFTIGGNNPTTTINVTGIDLSKEATYRFGFDGSKYIFKVTQGNAVYETEVAFNAAPADGFFTWNYMMPNFRADYNFIGSVSDVKFWTSYYYGLTFEGSSSSTYTVTGLDDGYLTAEQNRFKVEGNSVYKVRSVKAGDTVLEADGDGYYTLKNVREDTVITVITEADVGGHPMDNGTLIREASCEQDGVITYKCLEDGCDVSYDEILPALGHDYDDGVITTVPTASKTGIKTYSCQREGCDSKIYEKLSATGAVYYHWDFTDMSKYTLGSALTVKTADDSQAVSSMSYTQGASSELIFDAQNGLTRPVSSTSYFNILNKDGTTGITMTATNGFVMEFTAAFPQTMSILIGKAYGADKSTHPFFFREYDGAMRFGNTPGIKFKPTGIDATLPATYRLAYNGTYCYVTVTQGNTVYSETFTFDAAVGENFFHWDYLFPNFRDDYNFEGSILDLKIWTSYYFGVSAAKGDNYTTDIKDGAVLNADGSYTFGVTPDKGYAVSSVSVNSGDVTDNGDGTYTISGAVSDVSVDIETCMPGDANGDGKVDLIDLVRIKKYLAVPDEVEINTKGANVDKESPAIDADDAVLLIKYLIGAVKELI